MIPSSVPMRDRYDLHPLDAWCRRRWAMRFVLGIYFAAIAFYFGPCRILFGKWTWLAPADFIPVVQDHCVPTVLKMKLFERQHGHLPTRNEDIGLGNSWEGDTYPGSIDGRRGYEYWDSRDYNHFITYDFSPGKEGWYVRGEFTHGRIPCPPVTLPPSTRP